ncbi:MAG: tetratricopeptide repeat protein [Gammaproteobacteria bacterium]
MGQTNFATQLLHGLGVGQDAVAAASWYGKAAQQNYGQAQYALANLYAAGQGVDKDYSEARHWYERAALNGVMAANTGLALLYQNGWGVDRDLRKRSNISGWRPMRVTAQHSAASPICMRSVKASKKIPTRRWNGTKKPRSRATILRRTNWAISTEPAMVLPEL